MNNSFGFNVIVILDLTFDNQDNDYPTGINTESAINESIKLSKINLMYRIDGARVVDL